MSAMGCYKGLKQVRRVVEDCIKNVHPIYHIKTMMIKRELAKDPALAEENWDRFLPQFKKRNVKRRKPHKVRDRKGAADTPFPPLPKPSKVDLQLESGEYFLTKSQKAERAAEEKAQRQEERTAESRRKRQEAFVAPAEVAVKEPKEERKDELKTMASSLKKKAASTKTAGADAAVELASTYFEGGAVMSADASNTKKDKLAKRNATEADIGKAGAAAKAKKAKSRTSA